MTLDQAQALVAMPLEVVAEARQVLQEQGPLPARLRWEGRYEASTLRALLDCAASQIRFASKFDQATRWWLTREAAEQATASLLASWRAAYLRQRWPWASQLSELGSGLGGDSVYLARHFALRGYERDPARALLARSNLEQLSPEAREAAIQPDAFDPQRQVGDLLFADPARRDGSRLWDPERWDPPLSALLSCSGWRHLAIKTAPGLDLQHLPPGFEAHFLSRQGDLKECLLLRDQKATEAPQRGAWLWTDGAREPLFWPGDPSLTPPSQALTGSAYLHLPDPGLIRCGGLGRLAGHLAASLVDPHIAYLHGDLPSTTPWATSLRVVESLPLKWKGLVSALKDQPWSDWEYLSRGVPFSQQEVLERTRSARQAMKGRAPYRGVLVLYRCHRGYRAVLAERLSQGRQGKGDPGGTSPS